MKKLLLIALIIISCKEKTKSENPEFITVFETTKGLETATYQETISFYLNLGQEFSTINVQNIGETDSGEPLHLVTYNPEGEFNFNKIALEKAIILINNGIHPGESDGIDASMMLFRDLAQGKIPTPKNTVLTTIPIYNIGGALNRNSHSRANQNGPISYGFRGNAQNYDLNRDFIKADTKNTFSFSNLFHIVKPDVFIDTHVSNGADYQYTLSHLFTQHNKLGSKTASYLENSLTPKLEKAITLKNWDITPFVNIYGTTPDNGFPQFLDHPRYSSGYTTLWNTLGMMVETHMLKPYKNRVEGTYLLLEQMLTIVDTDAEIIKKTRTAAFKDFRSKNYYPIKWKVDSTKSRNLQFKGYQGDTIASEITGLIRLKYNRDQPFTKSVSYKNHYIATDSIAIPKAYIINKSWKKVIERLDANLIKYKELTTDTTITVTSYKIADYQTSPSPYEGHYIHKNTKVAAKTVRKSFSEGDIIIPTDQEGIRYIIETLEPETVDSFFNWNFFDIILQQKEHFSSYIFEDTALKLLNNDSVLLKKFRHIQLTDSSFAKNSYAQLTWIYKHSKHYEKAHLQYPIYKIAK